MFLYTIEPRHFELSGETQKVFLIADIIVRKGKSKGYGFEFEIIEFELTGANCSTVHLLYQALMCQFKRILAWLSNAPTPHSLSVL